MTKESIETIRRNMRAFTRYDDGAKMPPVIVFIGTEDEVGGVVRALCDLFEDLEGDYVGGP